MKEVSQISQHSPKIPTIQIHSCTRRKKIYNHQNSLLPTDKMVNPEKTDCRHKSSNKTCRLYAWQQIENTVFFQYSEIFLNCLVYILIIYVSRRNNY